MELRETFRAPFLAVARQRLARVTELLAGDGGAELCSAASELHCLAGEASMLEFQAVADLARSAEKAARDGERSLLARIFSELAPAVEALDLASPPAVANGRADG